MLKNIFKYFGWLRFRKVSKEATTPQLEKSKTHTLLNTFLNNALKCINTELGNQLRISGFDETKLRSGLFILTCEITEDKFDASIQHQTYRVGNIEIMRIEWKVNGFSIHVRERQAAKEIKKSIDKGLKHININPGAGLIINPNMSANDIELEVKAAKMVKNFDETPAPVLHVTK